MKWSQMCGPVVPNFSFLSRFGYFESHANIQNHPYRSMVLHFGRCLSISIYFTPFFYDSLRPALFCSSVVRPRPWYLFTLFKAKVAESIRKHITMLWTELELSFRLKWWTCRRSHAYKQTQRSVWVSVRMTHTPIFGVLGKFIYVYVKTLVWKKETTRIITGRKCKLFQHKFLHEILKFRFHFSEFFFISHSQ